MTPARSNIAHAILLAQRPEGVTAAELAEVAACPLRTAERTLQGLSRDGLLSVAVPPRKGQRRGDWRNRYWLRRKEAT